MLCWKEELKQFSRDSFREVMQEVEEEVSRISKTVDRHVGQLQVRLQAIE